MTNIFINHVAINCALGGDLHRVEHELFSARPDHSHLTFTDHYSPGQTLPLGQVHSELPATEMAEENTRNNRLLATSIRPLRAEIDCLIARYGAHRIGLVLGTSTSGISEGEDAVIATAEGFQRRTGYRYESQEFSAPARFVRGWLGLTGPTWVVSTACTSGGKALASASRLLKLGVCDAVIAGAVDTLCRMTMAGFSSLLVTSQAPCNPFSANRNGINIGEGAAVFVLSREEGPVRLAGIGETSDAHHISSPDPEAKGAENAMRLALATADIGPQHLDYINLHGTATQQNDAMEATAVNRVFGADIPCSSTKPLTGHTLAAAGAIEAAFCWLLLQRTDGKLPPHLWDGAVDINIPPLKGLGQSTGKGPRFAMSNSFAFGGNNISLVFARE